LKILVAGAEGQLGQELVRSLAPYGTIHALGRHKLDICNPLNVDAVFGEIRPDLVFNAAAYTAVDLAETEISKSWSINADGPRNLGLVAKKFDTTVIHFSTSYVFDGDLDRPYRESDPAAAINVYGASKLAGEDALMACGCRTLIFRISWLYAYHGNSFLTRIMQLATERESLSMVTDQVGSPNSAKVSADGMADLLSKHGDLRQISEQAKLPIYNLAVEGFASRHDLTVAIIENMQIAGMKVKTREVGKIMTKDFPTPAKRPLNSRFDTTRSKADLDIVLPTWRDALDQAMQDGMRRGQQT